MGPPIGLLRVIQDSHHIRSFIETGTYQGKTAARASAIYDSVVTIENSPALYEAARARYRDVGNIEFIFGHSSVRLKEVVAKLREPCVFWLDAHWSGGDTYGSGDECPLLEEISAINGSPYDHVILIDDARLFMAPPPRPHDASTWPTLSALLNVLNQRQRYTVISEDVVIAVPECARLAVVEYCQRVAEREWRRESRAICRAVRKLAGLTKKVLCERVDDES